MRKLILIIIIPFFISCTKQQIKFNKVIKLQSSILEIHNVVFGNPISPIIKDTLMFITDYRNGFHFSILDMRNQVFIKQFGKDGRGPNELSYPMITAIDKSNVLIQALNPTAMYYVDINTVLKNENFNFNILYEESSDNHNEIYFMCKLKNNDFYIATGAFENGQFLILNTASNIDTIFGKIDTHQYGMSQFQAGLTFQTQLSHHPNENKLLSYNTIDDILKVVTYNDDCSEFNIKKNSSLMIPILEKFNVEEISQEISLSKRSNFTYRYAYVTDKYCYLLFSGKSIDKHFMNAFMGDEIHVYDWDLNKIAKLKLDYQIYSFAVSDDDSLIYSFTTIDEDVKMVNWNIDLKNSN